MHHLGGRCPTRPAADQAAAPLPAVLLPAVLLKQDRESPAGIVAKSSDFGIAVLLQPQDGKLGTHVSNVGAGTPFYVAPEVGRHPRV